MDRTAAGAAELKAGTGCRPGPAIVLVGEDPASGDLGADNAEPIGQGGIESCLVHGVVGMTTCSLADDVSVPLVATCGKG